MQVVDGICTLLKTWKNTKGMVSFKYTLNSTYIPTIGQILVFIGINIYIGFCSF